MLLGTGGDGELGVGHTKFELPIVQHGNTGWRTTRPTVPGGSEQNLPLGPQAPNSSP